jgi:hypothetical protein
MRLPRFTVRRLMAWVAMVGLILSMMINGPGWMDRRRTTFQILVFDHRIKSEDVIPFHSPSFERRKQWHRTLAEKYQFAARWPFLPVWPDPPKPE